MIVAGGMGFTKTLKSSEELDLATLTWSPGPDLPNPIAFGESVPFRNSFLIVGGSKGYRYFDVIYEYNPENKDWMQRPQRLKKERISFTAFLIPDDVAGCDEHTNL